MAEFESFIRDKFFPLYRAHYALWVHWWPWWREKVSGRNILRQWDDVGLVEEGQTFLDYGCGTGSFTLPAARIVGKQGKVYALDCFPRQLEIVARKSREEGLDNIETILAADWTGLSDESVDIIWMCDVLHEIVDRRAVLVELHRVLKKDGRLVVYDGMRDKILGYADGLFSCVLRQEKLYEFAKRDIAK
ncbi:MAG: methyltransferase domain-containing protein [Chloroflexi bacterium]|nr:methyltransferase domain-containing protein [Chloroflexota bacterium]